VDVKQYLDRIELSQVEEPSPEFLASLQIAHLLTVPFENIDIHHGEEILLDLEHLFDKIVLRRRGGFCYELNGLFAWLLQSLGFEVSMISTGENDRTTSTYSPDFDHMVLLVQLSRAFLVDVGFGDCFRKPIPLPDGAIEDASGQYRLDPSSENQKVFRVEKLHKDVWEIEYCFDTTKRKLKDFNRKCSYHQTSPDSHFTQKMVCTLATPEGRKTLSSDNLTFSEGGATRKMPISSKETFYRLLFEHFGVSLDPVDEVQ
jgi:N-hydroxyarylamine O-acetyltransferase